MSRENLEGLVKAVEKRRAEEEVEEKQAKKARQKLAEEGLATAKLQKSMESIDFLTPKEIARIITCHTTNTKQNIVDFLVQNKERIINFVKTDKTRGVEDVKLTVHQFSMIMEACVSKHGEICDVVEPIFSRQQGGDLHPFLQVFSKDVVAKFFYHSHSYAKEIKVSIENFINFIEAVKQVDGGEEEAKARYPKFNTLSPFLN